MTTLQERIKKIRKSMGKSQKEMALLVGIGLRTWQQYEEGGHEPSWKVISKLSTLGFNIDWLASGVGEIIVGCAYPLSEGFKNGDVTGELNQGQAISHLKPDLTWFHDWIDEELQGKSMSEIMAVAVKMKGVLDESKGE